MATGLLINLLILILVGGLVMYLLFMLIDMLPLPSQANMVAKAVVVLIAIVILLQRTGVLAGI